MLKVRRNRPSEIFVDYRRYKPYLRRDFEYQCIFCTIHEVEWGGYLHFHVEHYRPKSRFPHLINDYDNLLYSCDVCNRYKGDDWPSDNPVSDGCGYLDPCEYDFDEHFSYLPDGTVCGLSPVANYMIERLHLNRNQIVRVRLQRYEEEAKYKQGLADYDEIISLSKRMLASLPDHEEEDTRAHLEAIVNILERAREKLVAWWEVRWDVPYECKDLR